MNRKRRFIYVLTGIVCFILVVGGAITLTSDGSTDVVESATSEKTALTVSTLSPEAFAWDNALLATGNVVPWQEAFVSTEASGVSITRILVDVGDEVKKGQALAELQNETLSAALEQAEAELAQARAAREEARADAGRARKLQQSSALSAQQITQYLVAEKVANARVSALTAQVKAAQLRVAQTRIVAPDDGVITQRQAMLGHVVSPGDVLFKLNRQNRLEWHAELPVSELGPVQIGQRVTLDIPGQAQASGQVRQIAPTVDKSSRNALVYVDLERHSGVRAGTFASGNIILGQAQALAVPQSALLLQDGFAYVFRVDEQGRVKQVRVTTGQRHDGWVEITRGVTREDVLVAAGVGFLSEGDRVRVVPPQPENAALSPIASPSLSTWPEGGK